MEGRSSEKEWSMNAQHFAGYGSGMADMKAGSEHRLVVLFDGT
jgi:hypothetical protein